MEMKQVIITVGVSLSIFFQACTSQVKEPTQNDILGTWISSDSGILRLNKDSSFIGTSLPAEYFTFFTSIKDVEGKKINGSGKWKIENGQGFKEVKLNFTKMDDKDIYGIYSVLISGETGVIENKPPWYLFVWKEEEGGERYKFLKQ